MPIKAFQQLMYFTLYSLYSLSILNSAHILGTQYRTISCSWGNATCAGHKNRQEKENVCVDSTIRDNFCFSGGWDSWNWAWDSGRKIM